MISAGQVLRKLIGETRQISKQNQYREDNNSNNNSNNCIKHTHTHSESVATPSLRAPSESATAAAAAKGAARGWPEQCRVRLCQGCASRTHPKVQEDAEEGERAKEAAGQRSEEPGLLLR